MSAETRFIVQAYNRQKTRARAPAKLVIGETKQVPTKADAIRLAERIHQKSSVYVGVDAYRVTVDDEAGEYGDLDFFIRLGDVPDLDD